MKYYDVKALLKEVPDADFYIIVGQRSNGKSTSVGAYFIDECVNNNTMFAYFSRKKNVSIIKDMDEGNGYFSGYLENYALDTYNRKIHTKDNAIYLGEKPLCKQFSITTSGAYKSKQYDDNYKYILFEEFVAEDGIYLRNEWKRFNSIISTIVRNRDAQCFLIGNTVSRFNPYFENFGIDIMAMDLKEGEHYVFKTPEGAKVCIDIASNVYENDDEVSGILKVKNNNIATGFNWQQSDMILSEDDIEKLINMYNIIPVCLFPLQDIINNDVFWYIMYTLTDSKSRPVCNLITRQVIVNQSLIDKLDTNDICYYIDVDPLECIKNGVKSFVDAQRFFRSTPELMNIFSQITFYDDDRIAHNYQRKLRFTDVSKRIGEKY